MNEGINDKQKIYLIALLAVVFIVGFTTIVKTIEDIFTGGNSRRKWLDPQYMSLAKLAATDPDGFLSQKAKFVSLENSKLSDGQRKTLKWVDNINDGKTPGYVDRRPKMAVAAKNIYDAVGFFVDSPEKLNQAQNNIQNLDELAQVVKILRSKHGKDLLPWLTEKMDTPGQKNALDRFIKYLETLPTGAYLVGTEQEAVKAQGGGTVTGGAGNWYAIKEQNAAGNIVKI